MSRLEWKLDEELCEGILDVLAGCLADLEEDGDGAALDAAEALGTLLFSGHEDAAKKWLAERAPANLAARLRFALDGLDGEDLDDAAVRFSSALFELREAADDDLDDVTEEIVEALAARDRVELTLAGARLVLGELPGLNDELASSIASFDSIVSERLWLTTRIGERRAARCAWALPERRAELWWWHRGCDIPAGAITGLDSAARLIQVFPEARAELELLIDAECALERSLEKAGAEVINLADYFRQKQSEFPSFLAVGACPGITQQLRFAAADLAGKAILERDEFSLSVVGDRLVVDLEGEGGGKGESAVIEAAGKTPLAGRSTEPGRFEFDLGHPLFKEARAVLRVRTAGREIELPLPVRHD